MGSLSNRQSILRPVSGRQAVAQLGLAQQPVPRPVSGRFLAAHLGVGRTRAVSTDSLVRHLPSPVGPEIAQFYHARSVALRIQQQLAAHDRLIPAVPSLAHAPVVSPTDYQKWLTHNKSREQLQQRLLADFNGKQYSYLPAFLRAALLAKKPSEPILKATSVITPVAGDSFMPISFWHTQYQETPKGWKSKFIAGDKGKPGHWSEFNHWADCCNTCKRLIKKQLGSTPDETVQIVKEIGGKLVLKKSAAAGYARLDQYMAMQKPVMIGVDFALGLTYNKDKTTEHFVVIVGTGIEKGRKYYRFFDVGTAHVNKGTNPKFKLYYNPVSGFCSGYGFLGEYTLTQMRF